jgi:DMSO reductase anchor subunit
MHPAYSVILFTTASGAGYGLLALLGLVGISHGEASTLAFGLTSVIIALALVSIGLLSSTLHLGHPERAWRAFSQWRSSWLSREGVAAVATFVPSLIFAAIWTGLIHLPQAISPFGMLTAIFCALTVYCTGQIYASLPTIRAWAQPLTVPVYFAFSLATGAALLSAIAVAFDRFQTFLSILTAASLLATLLLKIFYWRAIDRAPKTRTMESATGLGRIGKVRQWEVPHTAINFVQKEMGYAVARKHSVKLRRLALLCLGLAIAAILAALLASPFAYLAALLSLIAATVERWLFFAEARHVSMLYYGDSAV